MSGTASVSPFSRRYWARKRSKLGLAIAFSAAARAAMKHSACDTVPSARAVFAPGSVGSKVVVFVEEQPAARPAATRPAALLALAAAMLLRPRWFRRLPRWLRRTGGALLGAGLALLAAVLVMMAVQAGNRPGPEDCTVVVLGCQVSASGEPTVMLRDRIDAAYDYLTAHPESRCVASGGQNDNEPISEAACIRNTLAARGIDPDRILLEDRSRSTEENLRFTAEIIRQQGLNPRVAIASDNFHQLRASVWARRCGLEAESLGCASWWPLGPGYWAREAVAVVVLEVGSLL